MKKFIFIIQGYESENSTGQLNDSVVFELLDSSYDKALKRAKKISKKKFYRLARVIEKIDK